MNWKTISLTGIIALSLGGCSNSKCIKYTVIENGQEVVYSTKDARVHKQVLSNTDWITIYEVDRNHDNVPDFILAEGMHKNGEDELSMRALFTDSDMDGYVNFLHLDRLNDKNEQTADGKIDMTVDIKQTYIKQVGNNDMPKSMKMDAVLQTLLTGKR